MFLKASISTTKKFFRKTLKTLKSFLSQDYQRLPKSPPLNHFSCPQNYREFDMETEKKRSKKKIVSPTMKNEREVYKKLCFEKNYEVGRREDQEKKRLVREGKTKGEFVLKEGIRSCLVQEKLKELEMVDWGNIEHVLDIEEVLYYYSRLTCSPYKDIVDKFFVKIYEEISGSRPKW